MSVLFDSENHLWKLISSFFQSRFRWKLLKITYLLKTNFHTHCWCMPIVHDSVRLCMPVQTIELILWISLDILNWFEYCYLTVKKTIAVLVLGAIIWVKNELFKWLHCWHINIKNRIRKPLWLCGSSQKHIKRTSD